MKKIILPLIICLLLVGVVFADDAKEGAMYRPTKGIVSNLFSMFIPFQTVDYNGDRYTCSSEVNVQLTVGGLKEFKCVSGQICYTNSYSYPVVMQVFNAQPRTGQLGSDIKILPGAKGCQAATIGNYYNADLYYCQDKETYDNCYDTDGGIDYYIQGYTSLKDGTNKVDTCNGNSLTEYSCSSDYTKIITSTNSCSCCQGRCLKSGETCPEKQVCDNDGTCDSGETATNCANDCRDAPKNDTPEGRTQETTDTNKEQEVDPTATQPIITSYATPTYKILSDYNVEITYYIKNIGADMKSNWIFEVQPDISPSGIMALIGFVGSQRTCDSNYPENIHREFILNSGEKADIKFSLKVPPDQVTSDGITFIFPIIRVGCSVPGASNYVAQDSCKNLYTLCSTGNGCYQTPYCDGKSDVDYKNTVTNKITSSLIPVLLPHNNVCCFKSSGINTKNPDNYYCAVDKCSVHSSLVAGGGLAPDVQIGYSSEFGGYCPNECLPTANTIESIKLSSLEGLNKIEKQKLYQKHGCNVDIECIQKENEDVECMTLSDINEAINDPDFKDDVTTVLKIDKIGMCITDDRTPTDWCSWTSWAPSGLFGQCGNGYAIVILGFLIGYMIYQKSQQPRI